MSLRLKKPRRVLVNQKDKGRTPTDLFVAKEWGENHTGSFRESNSVLIYQSIEYQVYFIIPTGNLNRFFCGLNDSAYLGNCYLCRIWNLPHRKLQILLTEEL